MLFDICGDRWISGGISGNSSDGSQRTSSPRQRPICDNQEKGPFTLSDEWPLLHLFFYGRRRPLNKRRVLLLLLCLLRFGLLVSRLLLDSFWRFITHFNFSFRLLFVLLVGHLAGHSANLSDALLNEEGVHFFLGLPATASVRVHHFRNIEN